MTINPIFVVCNIGVDAWNVIVALNPPRNDACADRTNLSEVLTQKSSQFTDLHINFAVIAGACCIRYYVICQYFWTNHSSANITITCIYATCRWCANRYFWQIKKVSKSCSTQCSLTSTMFSHIQFNLLLDCSIVSVPAISTPSSLLPIKIHFREEWNSNSRKEFSESKETILTG